MPGTPPTTPNWGLPRYSQADDATFADQVNPIVDLIDSKGALSTDSRLTDQRTPLDGSVTAAKLAAGAVTAAALAAGAVTAAALAAGAVGTAALADQAVTDAKIANGTITALSLANGAVNTPALADGSVTPSKLTAALQPAVNLPGDLIVSAASSRAGALLCDGSAVSRATFAALFAAIGTSYGAGDGSTTFALPDFRQRVIVGAGAAAGDANRPTARQLGQVGGEQNHTLSAAEMPAHAHGAATGNDSPDHSHADAGHAHGIYGRIDKGTGTQASAAYVGWGATPEGSTFTANAQIGGASNRHTHSIASNGSSGAHNTMQPFGVANVFIKT